MKETTCSCSCGKAKVTLNKQPFSRILCHCTICQSVYKKPYADVTLLNGSAVVSHENVAFKKHRAFPGLSRGTCTSCGEPVVGLMPLYAFVPAARYAEDQQLPEPAAHIFYHSRTADVEDGIPKSSGYWPGMMQFTKLATKGLFA